MDDITQRIEFQNALIDTQKKLEELNQQKDKFFSIVAHDLRSPFAGMLGFAEILSEDYAELSEDEKKFYIDNIQLSLKNLLSLIDNLLTWARLNLNRADYNPQEVQLAEIIISVIRSQNIAASNKKIKLQSNTDKNISAFADPDMIETVIRNLVSNAIKFTNSDGIVKINAIDNGQFVKIEVEDNGVGMKPEIANNLFKIDGHVTTKGTNDEKGTGLGLIICKEFVEKHGGTISVASEVGRGTTISFMLPKKP
jgi:signal transduction histidine kinase